MGRKGPQEIFQGFRLKNVSLTSTIHSKSPVQKERSALTVNYS